jgi:hypothetical protein
VARLAPADRVGSWVVTVDDALAELGVTRTTPPDEARRAYLRELKKRKPEVDPAGFQRLREAYEVVRAVLAVRDAAPEPAATEAHEPIDAAVIAASAASPPAETPAPDPDAARLAEVERLVETKHRKAAVKLLAEHYLSAVARPAAAVPYPGITIDLLLLAQEKGWTSAAASLEAAFASWLQSVGQEVRVLGSAAPKWAIARELGAWPDGVPAEVRTALAQAGQTGAIDRALVTLREIGQTNPRLAKQTATLLRRTGRPLSTKLATALAPRWWQSDGRPSWRSRLAIACFALSILGRAATAFTDHTPVTSDHPYSRPLPPRPTRAELAMQTAARFAALAERLDYPSVADDARHLRDALALGDCQRAQVLTAALVAHPVPDLLANDLTFLVEGVKVACGDGTQEQP